VDDFTRNGVRYDVIIDTAGNGSLSDLRDSLTKSGILVIVGGSGGRFFMGAGRSLRATLLSPFVSQTLRAFISTTNKKDLEVLRDLVEAAKVTPVIDRTFSLEQAAEAVAHVGERHTRGKTVVTV